MKKNVRFSIVLAGAVLLASGQASAADVAKGKKVFNKCKACHSLVAGKKKVGPSLHGVFGRTAGTLKGFKFSKAMKAAGADRKIVWDAKTLDEYLAKPRKFIPKTRMVFPGLKKQADRQNLLAYLKEATK